MKKTSRIIAFILIVALLIVGMGFTYKNVVKNVNLGLDLQGGFEVLYQVKPLGGDGKIDDKALQSTAQTLENRVNVLGVSEPHIQVEDPDRIRVQLAGVKNPDEARKILSSQANLTIRDADDHVKLTGKDIVQGSAKQEFKQGTNEPAVTFKLKDRAKFKKVTEEISKKQENMMVVWLDYKKGDSYHKELEKPEDKRKYVSAASVDQPINSDSVEISGGFQGQQGVERAKQIAELLNAGSLPVDLKEVYSNSVGAQFGQDALDKTIFASMVGVAIIYLFMVGFYRLPGIVAVIALTVYVYLTLVAFNFISGVLTLPGLAALVLGVGMAVDANIIMYERIKDELRVGRTLKQAYSKANKSSFLTIFDSNLTTVIAAAVLFFFGQKYWMFGVNKNNRHDINEGVDVHDLKTAFEKWNFVKLAKPLIGVSILILVIGIIILSIFKLNLGIDFSSGTRIDLDSDTKLSQTKVERTIKDVGLTPDQIQINGNDNKQATVQFKNDLSKDETLKLNKVINDQYGHKPTVNTVSPMIGQELAKNAMKALIYAAIGIIIYVSLRFEWRMGLSAVLALLHDVFIIVALFSLLRLEVDITFIAAILTIVGYSINDTIVTFDRVRENLHKIKVITEPHQIDDIVNQSIRQTMTRSINTVLTVVVVVIAILIFGASSLFNFSLALLIGLLSGVFSSIFIAVPLWGIMKKHQLKKSENGKLVVYKEKKSNDEKILV